MQELSDLVPVLHKVAREYARSIFEAIAAEDVMVLRIASEKTEVVRWADPNWPKAAELTFKIECVINTGDRYELVSPGIIFREAILYYMLSDNGVDIYKKPIAGSVIVESSHGHVRWDVSAASRREVVTLARHVRGGPKIVLRD